MSKYSLFGALIFWLLIATYIVTAFDIYLDNDAFGVLNPINAVDSSGDTNISLIKSMAKTFTGALTVTITGLPAIFSLFFIIPTVIVAYMTLEILIKVVDAILPF